MLSEYDSPRRECDRCNGLGEIDIAAPHNPAPGYWPEPIYKKCEKCNGEGYFEYSLSELKGLLEKKVRIINKRKSSSFYRLMSNLISHKTRKKEEVYVNQDITSVQNNLK